MLKAEVSARADVMGEEVPQFAFASTSNTAAARGSEGEDEGESEGRNHHCHHHYHHNHTHSHKQQQHRQEEAGSEEVSKGEKGYFYDDDIGLEGVTIVMHMRDKDDLIIDTDLTQGQTQT